MTDHPFKGLVLAAGFGSRLRPLTLQFPKPIVPFLGSTPLELAFTRLHDAGIADLAVNCHYQADKIKLYIKEHLSDFGPIKISYEPEILGTGGAYNPIRDWLGKSSHLVVYNGDVITHINLQDLMSYHIQNNHFATMAVLPSAIAGESPVYCTESLVQQFGGVPPEGTSSRNFACVQILSPQFVESLPSTGSFDIISAGYKTALRNGKSIGAFLYEGYWEDIRNLKIYLSSQLYLLDHMDVCRQVWGDALFNRLFPNQ